MAVHYTTTTVPTTASDLNFRRRSSFFFPKESHFHCPMATRSSPRGVITCYQSKAVKAATPLVMPFNETREGNRIVGFMQGKSYFITGATGFLAKVFIEKLLRAAPETGRIFLLMKAKDQEAANKRLHDEIINSDLFEVVKRTHGKSYEGFMRSKLIPVVGDISQDNLGMDSETANKIAKEIDVIVSSAASTTFDDRYDFALNINTMGPQRLMGFSKKCEKLNLFLHFSTAYVNIRRDGIVQETPLHTLKVESEVKLASEALTNFHSGEVTQKMKELGHQRAMIHGYHNTYNSTKAMGEMVINSSRRNLPVVIIRPSIIESSYIEPFPGWIQGNRMADPVLTAYGKGQLPGFLGDPQTVADIVPVDMVVNAAMAAMAKHGLDAKPGLNIYHVTSSSVNPLLVYDLFNLTHRHFCNSPLRNSKGEEIMIEPMKFQPSMEDFSSYISKIIIEKEKKNGKLCSKSKTKCERKIKYFEDIAKSYKPVMFTKAQFDNSNTQKLMKDMSMEERRMFGFNTGSIDWEHYIMDVHLPGLKKHVMQEI